MSDDEKWFGFHHWNTSVYDMNIFGFVARITRESSTTTSHENCDNNIIVYQIYDVYKIYILYVWGYSMKL